MSQTRCNDSFKDNRSAPGAEAERMASSKSPDSGGLNGCTIAVVGAGIIGQAVAFACSNRGADVTVIEQDPALSDTGVARATTYTAAGMLTPNTEVDAPADVIAMGQQALGCWHSWLESFNADHLLQRGGCWVVSHEQDRPYFQHFLQQVQGLKLHYYQPSLQQPSLHQRCDLAAHFQHRVFFADECWVEPLRVQQHLRVALENAGAEFIQNTCVERIDSSRIVLNGTTTTFDWVLDCRGRFASRDLPNLRGVRGEIIEVEAPAVTIRHMVRLIHPRYALYVVPRARNHYIIGATQIESDDDSPISVRSALELLTAAYSIDRGFGEARIISMKSNCRPSFPDQRPAIVLRSPGVVSINGLFRHGILLAPLIAERAVEHLNFFANNGTPCPA